MSQVFLTEFGYEIAVSHIHLKHTLLKLLVFLFDFMVKGNEEINWFVFFFFVEMGKIKGSCTSLLVET